MPRSAAGQVFPAATRLRIRGQMSESEICCSSGDAGGATGIQGNG